jgi:hypothetical protein
MVADYRLLGWGEWRHAGSLLNGLRREDDGRKPLG